MTTNKTRVISVDDYLKAMERIAALPESTTILTTGPSGVGKDYFAAKVGELTDAHIILLDSYGSNAVSGQKGKEKQTWVIDWPAVGSKRDSWGITTKSIFVFGISDNMSDGISFFKYHHVYVIKPTLSLWREMQAAKATEYGKKKDHNVDWLNGWLSKAKYSQKQLDAYFVDYFEKHSKWLTDYTIVTNESSGQRVLKGWHKS